MQTDAAIGLIVLMLNVLVFMACRGLLTSMARQRLFEIRDEVFDMAVAGKIDFRSREYRTVRTSLEKLIRYAHDLSLTQFLVFRWHMKRNGYVHRESALTVAVNNVRDPGTRREIEKLVSNAHEIMFWLMIGKSPWTFYFYFGYVAALKFARSIPTWVGRMASGSAEVIQIEAESAPVNTNWQIAA